MKIILKEDVGHLGNIGDVITVADGYARNYLIPKNLAAEANPKSIKQFEHIKKIIEAKAEKVKKEKQSLADKISSLKLTFTAKTGEDGKLFGSITSMDIQKNLSEQGVEVDKKRIVIEEPIKRTGEYRIQVRLHTDIVPEFQVEVVPE